MTISLKVFDPKSQSALAVDSSPTANGSGSETGFDEVFARDGEAAGIKGGTSHASASVDKQGSSEAKSIDSSAASINIAVQADLDESVVQPPEASQRRGTQEFSSSPQLSVPSKKAFTSDSAKKEQTNSIDVGLLKSEEATDHGLVSPSKTVIEADRSNGSAFSKIGDADPNLAPKAYARTEQTRALGVSQDTNVQLPTKEMMQQVVEDGISSLPTSPSNAQSATAVQQRDQEGTVTASLLHMPKTLSSQQALTQSPTDVSVASKNGSAQMQDPHQALIRGDSNSTGSSVRADPLRAEAMLSQLSTIAHSERRYFVGAHVSEPRKAVNDGALPSVGPTASKNNRNAADQHVSIGKPIQNPLLPMTDGVPNQEHDLAQKTEFVASQGNSGRLDIASASTGPTSSFARPEVLRSVVAQITQSIGSSSGDVIEVRLSPEELGVVKYRISVSETGTTILVHADRPETLELLRRHAHDLRGELANLGYAGADIEFDENDSGESGGSGSQSDGQQLPTQTETTDVVSTSSDGQSLTIGGVDIRI